MAIMNEMRRMMLAQIDLFRDQHCVLDSLPIPVVQFHLAPQSRGDWPAHGANYGKVSSKKMTIYGFKLHMLITKGGLNRFLYARANPLKFMDPSGHCPRPFGQYAMPNIICVAGLIPTRASKALPVGDLYFERDDRGLSTNSALDGKGSSRFWVWIDADTGVTVKKFLHGTQVISWPEIKDIGPEYLALMEPSDDLWQRFYQGHIEIHSWLDESGAIHLNYRVICSHPVCNRTLDADGVMTFVPNEYDSFDVHGSINNFPNPEGYHVDPTKSKPRT